MSGKFNLCGIEVNYQNLVNCFANMSITQNCMNIDVENSGEKPLTKEELDQQIEEYRRKTHILKNHGDCDIKCRHRTDWIEYPLDDYIKHQEECENRYMKQFDDLETCDEWFQCEKMHPKHYLLLNFDKIPHYANKLGFDE